MEEVGCSRKHASSRICCTAFLNIASDAERLHFQPGVLPCWCPGVWIDRSGVNYLRMQGVKKAAQYGYSIYELQAYPFE